MSEDDALLAAVCESPEDATPKLIYADWLEERGEGSLANGWRWLALHNRQPYHSQGIKQLAVPDRWSWLKSYNFPSRIRQGDHPRWTLPHQVFNAMNDEARKQSPDGRFCGRSLEAHSLRDAFSWAAWGYAEAIKQGWQPQPLDSSKAALVG